MYLTRLGISESDLKAAMITGVLKISQINTSGFDTKCMSISSRYDQKSVHKSKPVKKKIRKYTTVSESHSSLGRYKDNAQRQSSGLIDNVFDNLESDDNMDSNSLFQRSISMGPDASQTLKDHQVNKQSTKSRKASNFDHGFDNDIYIHEAVELSNIINQNHEREDYENKIEIASLKSMHI